MAPQNRVESQRSVSLSRAERALRDLDDQQFSDVVQRELHRRSTFARVAEQIDGAMKRVQAPAGDPLQGPAGPARRAMVAAGAHGPVWQVPHACSAEAGQILERRGVLTDSSAADALRRFARDGRLIVLRGDRRWVYPRFQLDYFDPRDPSNIVCAVNRLLDAAHYPESATSWWTSPSSSLPGRRAPAELLGGDHASLRQLATAYASSPDR